MRFSELLVILVIVFVLFGAGKLPKVMADVGKGLKNFRDAMKEDEKTTPEPDPKKDA